MARAQLTIFKNVAPDGTIYGTDDMVPVEGDVTMSAPGGGCGAPMCNCTKGHFFQRLFPRDEQGIVFGYTVEFESDEEMHAHGEEEIARLAQQVMH